MGELLVSTNPLRTESEYLFANCLDSAQPAYIFFDSFGPMVGVSYWIDDPERIGDPTNIESRSPYDLAATTAAGVPNPLDLTSLGVGRHTLTVQAWTGSEVELVTHEFFVDTCPTTQTSSPVGSLAVPDGEVVIELLGLAIPIDGGTVAFAGGEVPAGTLRWEPTTDVDSVWFWLDDPGLDGYRDAVQSSEPYVYTEPVPVGTHTLTIAALNGDKVTIQTVSFTVSG